MIPKDILMESCVPCGQVPSGSFFRCVEAPQKKLQMSRIPCVALTDDYQMVVLKPDVPCVIESEDKP